MQIKQTVLITGGTGLIGKNLCRNFLRDGCTVISVSRGTQEESDIYSDLGEDLCSHFFSIKCDLLDDTFPDSLLRTLKKQKLYPEVLINNARSLLTLETGPDALVSSDNFQKELRMQIAAPYSLSMALVNAENSKINSIVNISSIYGLVAANPSLYDSPADSPIHYGVAKAGQNHLTKELAVRLAPRGIRVNAVAFGGVEGRADKNFLKRYENLCPQQRMLNPTKDLYGPVQFLAGESSRAVTGHILTADGGWTLW